MIKLFLSVLLSIFVLCGCTGENHIETPPVSGDTIIENDNTVAETENVVKPSVFDGGGQTVIPEKNVYYNKSANYLFEIPDTFLDYYSVFEHNNGERVTFIFNGKSDYVKNYCEEKNIPGIELFTIYSENDKELAGDEESYDDGFGKANNVKYYFTRPYDYDVFTDAVKNSLQGDELDEYLQDEQKFKSIYNKVYYTLAIENSFVGFGNYKTAPDDKGNYLSDVKGKYSPPLMPQSNVYVNEKCGYQLTFPEDWQGWYYIKEYHDGGLSVFFFGKSMTGSYYTTHLSEKLEDGEKTYGLHMFSIVTKADVERHTYDNEKYIGTAKGVEYYSVTGTDATLSAVYMPQEIWKDITEEEYQLAKKDWEKVQQMDYNEVTKTFKNLQ